LYKYIVNSDLDERIIPVKASNLEAMLDRQLENSPPSTSVLSMQRFQFPRQVKDDVESKFDQLPIRMMRKTEAVAGKLASKFVALPHLITGMQTHRVTGSIPGKQGHHIDQEYGYFTHHRVVHMKNGLAYILRRQPGDVRTDRSARFFAKPLIERILRIVEELPKECHVTLDIFWNDKP
jgi:hypothetical protein